MKKNNIALNLLKLIGIVFAGTILWVVIFSFFTPAEVEEAVEPFQGASLVFGLITGVALMIGYRFNAANQRFQHIQGSFSNIQIVKERAEGLLLKANAVVGKHMLHEKETLVGTIEARAATGRLATHNTDNMNIQSAFDLNMVIENYPELKVNQNIMKLLEQIQECENTTANFKIGYNKEVSEYNAFIHSFPLVFIRKIANLKDSKYYQDISENTNI